LKRSSCSCQVPDIIVQSRYEKNRLSLITQAGLCHEKHLFCPVNAESVLMINSVSVTTVPSSSTVGVDFPSARALMVDDQVRPVEVSDPRIIAAMRVLPRERCVPEQLRQFAYNDRTLSLGHGRVLMQAMVTARLIQAATIREGEKVLLVAAGTGYSSGILSSMGAEVIALESSADLATIGRAFTERAAPGVMWEEGPLSRGATDESPYDVIFFNGAISEIPAFCGSQLRSGGRVVGILRRVGGLHSIFTATLEKSGEWNIRYSLDVDVPLLPELAPAPEFRF
jgi:protein-L-isoaspartate(D-aspartate) O-methyltransferase